MLSKAAVRKQLNELRALMTARVGDPPMLGVVVPHGCPTPRFEAEAARHPQISIMWVTTWWDSGSMDAPAPEPDTRSAAVKAIDAALAADYVEWRTTPEFRELLAKEVRVEIDSVRQSRGARWALDALERARKACERNGVPVPPETQAVLDGRYALTGPAAEQMIEVPAWHQINDGSTKKVPALPAPASGPRCRSCGCHVDQHDAWTDERVCVYCRQPPQGHAREGGAGCGNYRGYIAANADRCACGRCPGLSLQPALPAPERSATR